MKWSLDDLDNLSERSASWNAINQASSNLPILDAEFFSLLLKRWRPANAKLAICEDGGTPIAAAILVGKKLGSWQTYQPSQAPMGAWVQRPDASLPDLLEELGKALPASTLLVSATQLDPDIVPRPASSERLATLDYIDTARLTLEGTFDAYWEGRGKNLKKNVKRQRNRLEREKTETRYEIVSSASAVGAAVDAYGVIESLGWKAEQGTALAPDNEQGRYYRELFETMAARGEAFVTRYFYDDDLVASDLYLERDGVLVLLKTTYDERLTTTSPSSLLREESLRMFFEGAQHRRVEFYGRVMDWHKKWTGEFRSLYHSNYSVSAIAGKLRTFKQKLTS